MSKEALEALGTRGPESDEPIVQAARILADAIDRLNVALTGPGEVDSDGHLGWIGSALGVMAEVSLGRGKELLGE